MKYIILGKNRNEKSDFRQVDVVSDVAEAKDELYNLQRNHPSWVFWLKVEKSDYDKEIQSSFCPESESQV